MEGKLTIHQSIFRAYDIRGVYPKELNEETVAAIARAFCVFLGRPRKIVIGRDVRISGPALFRAAKTAVLMSGADVVEVGVLPVDVFYFAVSNTGADGGIYISASHNPREWNGLNLYVLPFFPQLCPMVVLERIIFCNAGVMVSGVGQMFLKHFDAAFKKNVQAPQRFGEAWRCVVPFLRKWGVIHRANFQPACGRCIVNIVKV